MAQKFLTNFTPPGSSESYKFRAGGLFYGETSNSTTAMTVSIPGVTEYYTGLTLVLKMGAQAASNCTLNVNSLGAKQMKYGANSTGTYFASGATYLFVYNGTDFTAIHSYNSNTTYSSMSVDEGKAGTATTSRVLTAKNLKDIIVSTTATSAKNGIFYVEGNSTGTEGSWTGTNTNIPELFAGLTIAYKIGIKGISTGTTLDLTTAAGASGAKSVKRNTSNLTTHLGVGTVVLLTYDGTNWVWADYDSNTKNTAGSTDTSDKIFLIGAKSQAANPQTYSHDTAYVGADGFLYSGGQKVLTSYTDTKNTAGSTDSSSKLFLIGATSQAANPQTYSHDTAYIGTDGCLYSGGQKVLTSYTDTTYSAGTGLSLSGTTFNHSNSITAKTSYTQNATTSPGYAGTFNVFEPKYDAQGHITGVRTTTVTMPSAQTIPTELKNPNSLTIGNVIYDGSSAKTVTAADLGITGAMIYKGSSSTEIKDGGTQAPTIGGTAVATSTLQAGNVVLYNNQEFVWNGSKWELLGDEGSYKVKQTAVNDPSASGTSTTFIATISQDANGAITATKKTVQSMSGATASAAGKTGLVPAPAAGKDTSFLRGDGNWAIPNNYYHTRVYSSGLKITTGTGVSDIYVPTGTTSSLGVVKQHGYDDCTSYTSDEGATTPKAVKKAFSLFGARNGVYYVEGNSSGTAGTWTGSNTDIPELFAGLTIAYKIGIAGGSSSTTLNLTTADGASGAKTVYMNASTAVKTQYPVGAILYLTYDGSSWKHSDYNTNTTYSVVTNAKNGLVPMFDAVDGTIDSDSTDWVLTNNNGSIGWYKLPANAFKNDNTVYTHPSYTARTGVPTADTSLTFGGTFTVSQPVSDGTGHITALNTRTYTMPSDRLFQMLVPTGTQIPANADLKTTTYLKVGRYYCASNANAGTLKNCPTSGAFMMEVYSPLSTTIDNETTGTWVYRTRKIMPYNNGLVYVQCCYSNGTANNWTYGDWQINPVGAVTIDTTDTNGGTITVGATNKPVYVNSSGVITPISYTIDKSVPSDAKFTDTVYTHPTTSGNKHIPSGGSSGQILRWSADGTAAWGADNNTTYSAGTGLTLTNTEFSISKANVSTIINLLDEGTSPAEADDYIVAQYAGGNSLNPVNKTYYRRKVSNIVNAARVKAALGTGSGTTRYLREDGTWAVPTDTNTDTKVTQSETTTSNYRPILVGATNTTTVADLANSTTSQVYASTKFYAKPSTGDLYAITFNGALKGNASTATKLAAAKTIQTNLASTTAASFDGSANITPGVTGILGIGNGGTGANTAIKARVNLISIGSNPITKPEDDTVANWGAYGPCATAFYSATGQLTDQPSQWGFVHNIMTTTGTEVHQLWATQAGGDVYHRGGNGSGWATSWKKFLDSSNYNSYSPTLTGGGASGTWGISITGNAATADKLNSSAGSSTKAIYFSGGKPVQCNDTIAHNITGSAASISSKFSVDTSRYNQVVTWYDSDGTTQHSYIGAHNTGNSTGAIIINPVKDSAKDNWSSDQGLYIGKTALKFWGSDIVTCEVVDTPPGTTTSNLYVSKSGDTMTGNLTAPKFIGALQGKADTATKLATARTISLTGAVTGSGSFDGSGNLSISTTIGSHTHSSYLPLSGGTMTGKIGYNGGAAEIGTLTSSNYNTGEVLDVGLSGSGIYKGNGDGSSTGTSGVSNLIIKSWYGVGFATSCYNVTNPGISLAINTRTGDVNTIGKIYGAVWNDYAEYRTCKQEFIPGQVVFENGDDTISISTERLQRGCSITSDTFGFAIGETENAKCPIAVSGRVLAYPYESREEFAKHIGWPVCSGPNGTVSIMTEEEEEKYPSRIIGTISAVPDYEEWGSGNIKVNNRVWIKIK